jgi:hypothetical protein
MVVEQVGFHFLDVIAHTRACIVDSTPFQRIEDVAVLLIG